MGLLSMVRWSPYVAGIGIGMVSWLAFLLSNKPLGCSTALSNTSGMIERLFRGRKVLEMPYYEEFPPIVDWQWMLVAGVVIGSFISARLSGRFRLEWVPTLWAATFGPAPLPRLLVALCGGILMGMGARWAGGCTSGHGISGTLQLSLNSWIATVCFFAGGIATAMLIFNVLRV